MSEELKKRIFSAVVGLFVVLFALFHRNAVFFLLLLLILGTAAVFEAVKLVEEDSFSLLASVFSLFVFLLGIFCKKPGITVFGLSAVFLFAGIRVFWEKDLKLSFFLPFFYIAPPLGWALYLKLKGEVLFLLAVALSVWAGDTAAYFVGKNWGKKAFHPISPKKTWEGTVAGLLAGSVFSGFLFVKTGFHPVKAFLFGLFLNASGQLGDLFESFLKRRAGVKDSGFLFPGHGGVLDRIDSLLFALFASGILG